MLVQVRWFVWSGVLALALPWAGLAQEAGSVGADGVEARTGPGSRYEAWRTFSRGEAVQVLERRGAWLRVRVPGWVDDRHVALDAGGETGRVTAEALNVRGEPAGKVMQWLARGDQVSVRGRRGHWMQIDSHTWVAAGSVRLEQQQGPPVPPQDEVLDEGLPLDIVPPQQQEIEPPPPIEPPSLPPEPLPIEPLPIEPLPIEPLPIEPPVVTDVPQLPVTDPQGLPVVPAVNDGRAALRLLQGVPALGQAFRGELSGPDREARAAALLTELLGSERSALHARHGARFVSPAALDEAVEELRLRARQDPDLARALARRDGLLAPPQDDLLCGVYRLEGKQGPARLIVSRGSGQDLEVRREELTPEGTVSAVKTGFGRLDGDELEVTYASSRSALEQLQALYEDVGTVVVPGAKYELDLRTGRIRGRHYARGQAVQDPGVKEEGWRADRVEPVAGVYDLMPGYLIGKDPIELVVRARPDGRYDLVRTTRKGPREVEILEGEGTLEGRELKASFGGGYTVHEDGRIDGRVAGHSWGEKGWKRSVVRPLVGEYVLRPTWYAFGKKPPIALQVREGGPQGGTGGQLLVTRQAEGQALQRGVATVRGRRMEVQFEDGTRARYEVREDGKIEGAHRVSSREEAKSEGGWRQDLHVDPRWFEAAIGEGTSGPTSAR